MSDLDRFQTEGVRLQEAFGSLKDDHKFVLDWWASKLREMSVAYQGLVHIFSTTNAGWVKTSQELRSDIESLREENQALKDRCEKLEAAQADSNAAIGELQEGFARMREWWKSEFGDSK